MLLNNDQIWNWLILIEHWKVMKMSDFWPTGKAIALVFCSIMTKFEIDWFWLNIEKWWKWAIFGQRVRLYPWYFAQKWPSLKLIDFDWTLKSDDNERFLAKTSGYSLGISLYNWPNLKLIDFDWTSTSDENERVLAKT